MAGGGQHRPVALRRRVAGVSLLEMLLVVLLIAIGTALAAMVLTGGLTGMKLRSEAREIAAQMRYTRAQAMSSGRAQRFVIEPRTHRWTAAGKHRGEVPRDLGIAFIGAREMQQREGEGVIVFFHDGGASGGRVRLSAKSAHWDVDVAWLTGEVRVVRGGAEP